METQNNENDSNQLMVSPFTGELIDMDSLSQVIDELYEAQEFSKQLSVYIRRLKMQIQEKSDICENSLTSYASSKQCVAKIVYKGTEWDKSKLRGLYDNDIGHKYIKIKEVSPVMVEIKKLMKETSDCPEFNTTKSLILSCLVESNSPPSITVSRNDVKSEGSKNE